VDWQNIVGVAGFIIAVGSLSLVGLMRERLSNQGAAIDEFRNRVGDLEKERNSLRADLSEVQSENKLLNTMVMGKVEWVAITDQLEEHHRQALQQWAGINRRLDTIHVDLSGGK
jgi:hypothetical protein